MDQKNEQNVSVTHPSRLKGYYNSFKSFLKFMYNPETKEVIGRDGLSWAKISLCYFFFYLGLGSFFVGFLAVFVATLSFDVPRYYGETSIMSTRLNINPGLGFRPQLDPEDLIIAYSMKKNEDELKTLTRSLGIYLDYYYNNKTRDNQIDDCIGKDLDELRAQFKTNHAYCNYDYKQVLAATPCSEENNFGYSDFGPCVALKLNKIYDWVPKAYQTEEELPEDIKDLVMKYPNREKLMKENIFLKCNGEYSADLDAVENTQITYYSKDANIQDIGLMPFYYYPYLNQPGYRGPLVFIQFKNLPKFELVNILCKAYAANIDSDDKLNLRGMTRFQLYVEN